MDHQALRILMDRHWAAGRWKTGQFTTAPDDFQYARDAGYLFDDITVSHDAVVARLLAVRSRVSRSEIVDGFLASLNSRRLELRSAFGSYAVARHFPEHAWTRAGREPWCAVCGMVPVPVQADLNVLNFERYKWGGVRHDNPLYAAFDLEQFEQAEKLPVRADDHAILTSILDLIRAMEPDARPRTIEQRMSGLLRSNQPERETVIDLLGYAGILESPAHPGYFSGFVNYVDRTYPPVNKIDWCYPVCWWRGSDGINEQAIAFYFGAG